MKRQSQSHPGCQGWERSQSQHTGRFLPQTKPLHAKTHSLVLFREKAGSTACLQRKQKIILSAGEAQTTTACRVSQFCSSPSSTQNSPLLLQATGIPLPAPEMEGDVKFSTPWAQVVLETSGSQDKGRSPGSLGREGELWVCTCHGLADKSRQKNCILLRDTHDHLGRRFIAHPAGIPFLGLGSAPAWDTPLVG